MDPCDKFMCCNFGSWEHAYWGAQMQRYFIKAGGWRAKGPARRLARVKAIDMMYSKGWYRNCENVWTFIYGSVVEVRA